MFYDRGGKVIEVHGCKIKLPPQPPSDQILNSALPIEEQVWRRTDYPTFRTQDIDWFYGEPPKSNEIITWYDAYRQEMIKRAGVDIDDINSQTNKPQKIKNLEIDIDPYYQQEAMVPFRDQERRRCFVDGLWIYIKGEAKYFPPSYYEYLNWWKQDVGYIDFWQTDLNFYYVWEYIKEHPSLLGLVYYTKRGVGKSAKFGHTTFVAARASSNAQAGIQSSTETKADELLNEKIFHSIDEHPEFLLPVIDRKFTTKVKMAVPRSPAGVDGNYYTKILKAESLNTEITTASPGENEYNSKSLIHLIQDEIGQTDPGTVDVVKRLQKARDSVVRANKKRGIIVAGSSIEDMTKGGRAAKEIWDDSNQYKFDIENGETTKSKLIKIFDSAQYISFIDQYGQGVVDPPKEKHIIDYLVKKYNPSDVMLGAKQYLKKEIEKYKDNPDGEILFRQQNPQTEKDLFYNTTGHCIFSRPVLNKQKIYVSSDEFNGIRRYRLQWKDGIKDSQVEVVQDPNGPWKISYLPLIMNDVRREEWLNQPIFYPTQGYKIRIGADPIEEKKLSNIKQKSRASKMAISIGMKANPDVPVETYNTTIANYLFRHENPKDDYEQFIMALYLFSGLALVETNKISLLNYIDQRGYSNFLLVDPKERDKDKIAKMYEKGDYGVYQHNSFLEYGVDLTKQNIVEYGHNLIHIDEIEDLEDFKIDDTTKFDAAIAKILQVAAFHSTPNHNHLQSNIDIDFISTL